TVVLGSVYAGVDAVAGRNANASRLLRGSAAYYVGALRAVVTWRPAAYRVTVDGELHERRGYTVVAANSGFYGFGRHIAPDARVDDGLLDVVIIKHAPKPLFFAVMRELEDGAHVRRPQVEVLRGREVRIEADRELPYGADGETREGLPVTVQVMPGAVAVLRP
ncbi:MAG: diacylglycerol kinase family lipid kinase, partial [Actinomadura sp.]